MIAALVLGVGLAVPTFFHELMGDDLLILAILEEWYPEQTNSYGIYDSLLEGVELGWWVPRDVNTVFFRPLSATLLRLDHALFGQDAFFWHLQSALWLVALLLAVSRLYGGAFPRLVAGWALLAFALEEAHSFTAGWISNRHSMVSCALGACALIAHRNWRDGQRGAWPLWPLWALFAYVGALTGGEVGIAFLGYGFCYEMLGRGGTLRARVRGTLPMLALGSVYVAYYKLAGHGAYGGGAYIDPATEPLRFLGAAVTRIPTLLAGAFTAVPPDLSMMPGGKEAMAWFGLGVSVGVVGLTTWAWRHWDTATRRGVAWTSAGACLALVPTVATFPGHRQLLAPMLGFAPLVAALLLTCWRRARGRLPDGEERRGFAWVCWPVVVVLFVAQFLLAPVVRVGMQQGLVTMNRGGAAITASMTPAALTPAALTPSAMGVPPDGGPRDIVWIVAPEIVTALFGRINYDVQHVPFARSWDYLSFAPHDHRLTRVGERVLELEVVGGEMLATSFETVWAPMGSTRAGDVVEWDLYRVDVLEEGEVGPTRVRFTFRDDLERDDLALLVWRDGAPVRVSPPAVGEALEIPYEPSGVELPGT